jgi:DNA-binding Lrp family transcriptional regulator
MSENEKKQIRSLSRRGWYWINREILAGYGKRLKSSGIAVYNVLASYANQKTQTCFPTQQTIAKLLGLSRTTVNRKIRQLRELGLLNIMKLKSHCLYFLLGPDASDPIQPCIKRDTGDVSPDNINNNNRTRININNIDNKNIFTTGFKSFKEFEPKTREELLALDMAQALNDLKSLPLYLKYAQTLPESLIRETLSWIKQVPDKNIKRSRAALFNFIIKKHVKRISSNHRH